MSYPNPYGGGQPPPGAYPPPTGNSGYPPQQQSGYPTAAPGSAFGGGAPAPGYPPPPPQAGMPQPAPYGAAGAPSYYGAPQQQGGGYGAPPPAGFNTYQPQQPGYGQGGYSGYAPSPAQGVPPPAAPGMQPGGPPTAASPYGATATGYPASPYGQPSAPPASAPPASAPPVPAPPVPAPSVPAPPTSADQQNIVSLSMDMERLKVYGTLDTYHGTVKAAANFDSEKDAEVLRKAMYGRGTDEKAIIDVIINRSNKQRQEIKKKFKTMYGKDLIKDLESELSGDFREAIMALFSATTYYDAWSLRNAMEGLGTKEQVLIEIMCTRSNAEIHEIVDCYKNSFRRDLEKDIKNDTSGHFKRLLISACQGNRDELDENMRKRVMSSGVEAVVDREKAKREAQELYKAGEKKIGTDESTFNRIISLRHYYQLRATFDEYTKIAQRDILNSVEREFSGDVKKGWIAVVMSCRDRPQYFADRLWKAMIGAGTDDAALIRIIVSRSEIDLVEIKKCFLDTNKKTLWKMIEGEARGDYKRLLQSLVGRD